MRRSRIALLLVVALLPVAGCRQSHAGPVAGSPAPNGPEVARLRSVMETVRPLYLPHEPGIWDLVYPEHGQTFQEYLAANPNVPRDRRRILYVRQLGDLTPAQHRILEITAEYLEQFYGLPARIAPALPIAHVPARARRFNRFLETEQIQTGYLMDLLKRALPDDAFAQIGLTASDLYPDEKMNFVFGQSTLRDRVGVWSLHWLGEPDQSEAEFRTTLARTLKVASHETGHMFSIPHCTKYHCIMNGAFSLDEVDFHPFDACPECMAKICWATRSDPRERYRRLASFFSRQPGMGAARASLARRRDALAMVTAGTP
jgi:archaemetzincin